MVRLIFCQTFLALAVSANIQVCKNKSDCSEDSYCNNGNCQKCFSCEQLHRKGRSCVFDFSQCGNCLEGFEETLITDFSKIIKPCKAVKMKKVEECKRDENCPPNKYCLQKSCVQCFDCNLFNRLPPPKGCAKKFDECKSCFEGFYEVPVTTLINTKPCVKENVLPEVIKNKLMFAIKDNFPAYICVVLAICLFSLCWSTKQKKSKIDNSKYPLEDAVNENYEFYLPSAPTLSVNEPSEFPLSNVFFDNVNLPLKFNEEEPLVVSLVNERMQSARVYQKPTAPYYYFPTEREVNIVNERSQEGENTFTISQHSNEVRNEGTSPSSVQSVDATDSSSSNISNEENAAQQPHSQDSPEQL